MNLSKKMVIETKQTKTIYIIYDSLAMVHLLMKQNIGEKLKESSTRFLRFETHISAIVCAMDVYWKQIIFHLNRNQFLLLF